MSAGRGWTYVPSSLRSEVSEYSSLLRALRTNNILDVSTHLIHHARDDKAKPNISKGLLPQETSSLSPPTGGEPAPTEESSIPDVVSYPSRKRKRNNSPSRKRDNWTRWPLLLADIPKLTWSFEDEVVAIASHASKLFTHPLPSSLSTESRSDFVVENGSAEQKSREDEDEELAMHDLDLPSYYKFIASSASELLTNMLVLLSLHIPPRPPSMQNRIEPLDWHSVLEIFSVYGDSSVVDESIINNVTARMESLYQLPLNSSIPKTEGGENLIAYRVRTKNAVKQSLEENMSTAFDGLFTLPPPDFQVRLQASREALQPKRKKRAIKRPKQNSKKYKTILTDQELEEDVPLATAVAEKAHSMGGSKDQALDSNINHESVAETDTARDPENMDPGPLQETPEPEKAPSKRSREVPSRRAKASISYSIPSYFFDKEVMGG